MQIAYGKNTPTAATDPEVVEVRQIMETITKVLRSGNYLADWIPWLKYFPWYGQELRRGYEKSKRLNTSHLNRVRQQTVRSVLPILTCRLICSTAEQ
jgi:hypothetical protein